MSASVRRVVLTGIGVVTPLGLDLPSFTQALLAGRSGIGPFRSFDASALPVRFGGEVPGFDPRAFLEKKDRKALKMMVRTSQLAVAGSRLALADAGLTPGAVEPTRFGVSFGTPPADSTGVAHILEHSVLCGSRKYPIKEPFVELMKSSLNTFLNAMTFPDKTCYPVASQNVQDFYNLVDVYLDAVLFPLISENTFRQEGWHYELDSTQAPLTYKGVVFNEMKGAYSAPERRLHAAVEALAVGLPG